MLGTQGHPARDTRTQPRQFPPAPRDTLVSAKYHTFQGTSKGHAGPTGHHSLSGVLSPTVPVSLAEDTPGCRSAKEAVAERERRSHNAQGGRHPGARPLRGDHTPPGTDGHAHSSRGRFSDTTPELLCHWQRPLALTRSITDPGLGSLSGRGP